MNRVVIIHGWEGSPDAGWEPWLARVLQDQGFQVSTPAMPDTFHPIVSRWLNALTETVGAPDEHLYLVGHSLGCITILRYLESLPAHNIIGGAILVAGFAEDLSVPGYAGQLANFFERPLDWERVRSNCKQFIAIHSDNDKWVDAKHLDTFKIKLNAESFLMHIIGHFSGDEGHTDLPLVYDSILRLAKQD
jgi:predicted alpha/beta hydrolase family esterase